MAQLELDRLPSYDDEALLAELRRTASLVPTKYLTCDDFDRLSKASSSYIRKRFGGWRRALTRAGLTHRFSGGEGWRTRPRRTLSDDELLNELRRVADKLGGEPLTIEAFTQHASMHGETVRRRFGSWWTALKNAGLPISNLGKRCSDDDYFENLLTVWTHYGRQPKYGDMDVPPSWIRAKAYEAKWGTWTKALLAFLVLVNVDVSETPSPPIKHLKRAPGGRT